MIRLGHLSEAQARAYRIADNQLALNAGWDEALLAEELKGLVDEDVDLALLGFADAEPGRLLALEPGGDGEGGMAAVVVPEPPRNPVSQVGDLWLLGGHRLLCGDSTSPDDVRRLMNGERAVLFATDPPYLVDYDGTVSLGEG